MSPLSPHEIARFAFSPLVLADRLLDLAHEADRAGYASAAERLVRLAFAVCDEFATGMADPLGMKLGLVGGSVRQRRRQRDRCFLGA